MIIAVPPRNFRYNFGEVQPGPCTDMKGKTRGRLVFGLFKRSMRDYANF